MGLSAATELVGREQVVFSTSSGTGTVRYVVPDGKTAYLSVLGTGTGVRFQVNGQNFYAPLQSNGPGMQMVFVGGTVISDSNSGTTYFSGYIE